MKFCGSVNYYTEEGMKSYLSTSNRVLVKFMTKDHPSADQMTAYQQDSTPIGFQLLWTEVDSLFCVDDSHSICADRTRLCINSTLKCDGISNCAENDDSDEQYCYSRGSLTLIGLAAIFSLVLLFLVSSLFVCKLYCRRKRVEKHKRIEGSRKDFSEKITTITKANPSEVSKEDHAKLLSKQARKQNAQTTATCSRPNFHKPSPKPRAVTVHDRNRYVNCFKFCYNNVQFRRPSQAQENVVNGLNNKHTIDPPPNQNCQNSVNDRKDLSEEPPVWEMATQEEAQLTSFKVGVDTTAANENMDDFAQSIQIIRRALV
ncbi:CUB domain containing protein [Ditylenchus destructor]|nr:CUB domain containing protein [Ditylenchus destructor]